MKNTTKTKATTTKTKKAAATKPKTTKRKATTSSSSSGFHSTKFNFMTSVLIVSLLLNLFTAAIWITLQVTTIYDASLYDLFIGR